MKKLYTILLLRPDDVATNYGQDTFCAHVEGDTVEAALVEAQQAASSADGNDCPEDYYCLFCTDGHVVDYQDGHGGVSDSGRLEENAKPQKNANMRKPDHYKFAGYLEPYLFSNCMAKPVGVAFDYIWRMHHKDTPESNVEKALRTLEQIKEDPNFPFLEGTTLPRGVLAKFRKQQALLLNTIASIKDHATLRLALHECEKLHFLLKL